MASDGPECQEIVTNNLGWDITDFGSNDFLKRGLFLFTIRNGNVQPSPFSDKKYAEKIMIVEDGQETPMHFHHHKMEDIINRGGGTLVMQCYQAGPDASLSYQPLQLSIDGISKTYQPGEHVALRPGQSICLKPGVYHRFWAEGKRVLAGEVSTVNDDHNDNIFLEEIGRFPAIKEDCTSAFAHP